MFYMDGVVARLFSLVLDIWVTWVFIQRVNVSVDFLMPCCVSFDTH